VTPTETGFDTFDHLSASNPGMLDDVYGLKIDVPDGDTNSVRVTFESNRTPVWGDIYAKDGKHDDPTTPDDPTKEDAFLYNTGWDSVAPTVTYAASPGITNQVLVPDTQAIPEAGVILRFLSLGCVGLAFSLWRRMRS